LKDEPIQAANASRIKKAVAMHYVFLSLAIIAEVIGTAALKSANGFTRPGPSLVVLLGYGTAFFLLSLIVQTMPLGIVYAVWSGAGIVLVAIVGALFLKQIPDLPALIGMALILAGVVVVNLFSKTVAH
jgi:small multidrug resistance pump